jgi:hypothetical protein
MLVLFLRAYWLRVKVAAARVFLPPGAKAFDSLRRQCDELEARIP